MKMLHQSEMQKMAVKDANDVAAAAQSQKKMWVKVKVNVDAVVKDFCLF